MSKLYVTTAFPHGVYSTELPESGTAVWEAMFLDDTAGDVGPKYYAVVRENDIAAFKQVNILICTKRCRIFRNLTKWKTSA